MTVDTQVQENTQMPTHVAIIMDGNGRWAQKRGLPRTAGHKQGADTVEKTVRFAHEMGIKYLTLFAFSTENWQRPKAEVLDLMGILRFYLKSKMAEMHKNNVKIKVIGDRINLDDDIKKMIQHSEDLTQNNTGIQVNIALSYSGRWDIMQACQTIAGKVQQGELSASDINEDIVSQNLSTNGIPDADLLIRTSGEERISNFMLWQCAYAELYFTSTLWPDFNQQDLEKACESYRGRDRRFGARVAAI